MEKKAAAMCLTVVVGRQATVDGSVLVGHNEENEGPYFVNFRRVHAQQLSTPCLLERRRAWPKELQQPRYGFLWSQIPGREYSDNYLNDAGVVIVSNGCPSREDDLETLIERNEIQQEGIGGLLRRLAAEQASSARHAVDLIAQWVEQFGYRDSGRTYVAADPQEAWIVAVVRGRHWLACRVPDEAAVVVPNVFLFDQIPTDAVGGVGKKPPIVVPQPPGLPISPSPTPNDLPAGALVRHSADLLAYAIQRGWYNPASGKPFSFREAYQSAERNRPDVRQWWGQQVLLQGAHSESFGADAKASAKDFASWTTPLPWYVVPPRKLSIQDVAAILCNQEGPRSLFHPATQETAVFQLRSDLPTPIGCVYWRTVGRPDGSPLLPWYIGVQETPMEYCHPAFRNQLEVWNPTEPLAEDIFQPDPRLVWWKFQELRKVANSSGEKAIQMVRSAWTEMQQRLWRQQPETEHQLLSEWLRNPESGCQQMTSYCQVQSETASREVQRLLRQLAEQGLSGQAGDGRAGTEKAKGAACWAARTEGPTGDIPERPGATPPWRRPGPQ